MDKKYSQLVKDIRDAIRAKAQDVPKFRDEGNGCIRILFYPCCKEADEHFDGLSDYRSGDIVDYEYAIALTRGGRRVSTDNTADGGEYSVDCYGYSAMKIAHCSHAQDIDAGLLSGIVDDSSLTEECGYGPHPGALCVEVKRINTTWDTDGIISLESERDYLNIYICVSGADSLSDLRCAFEAVGVIVDFFASEPYSYKFVSPPFPDEWKEAV